MPISYKEYLESHVTQPMVMSHIVTTRLTKAEADAVRAILKECQTDSKEPLIEEVVANIQRQALRIHFSGHGNGYPYKRLEIGEVFRIMEDVYSYADGKNLDPKLQHAVTYADSLLALFRKPELDYQI